VIPRLSNPEYNITYGTKTVILKRKSNEIGDTPALILQANTKMCTNRNCEQANPQSLLVFAVMKNSHDGYQRWCKSCVNQYTREHRDTDEVFMSDLLNTARGNNNTRNKKCRELEFTLTLEELNEKLVQQNGLCYITNMPMMRRAHSHFKCSIERLDDRIGYTDANTVLVISEVNTRNQWTKDKFNYLFSDALHPRIEFTDDDLQAPTRVLHKSHRKWILNDDGTVLCHNCDTVKPRTDFNVNLYNGCKVCIRDRNTVYRNTWWGALITLYNSANSHAETRGIKCELTFECLVAKLRLQGGLCYYSGVPMTPKLGDFRISLERLDVTKNYTSANTVLICQEFNSGDLTRRIKDNSAEGCAGWSVEKYQRVMTGRVLHDCVA
jgi:hypothetical protein